jgi:hypothetical protein
MWNIKYRNTPVITEAFGIATNGLKKNSEAIARKHSIDSEQKTAVLGS